MHSVSVKVPSSKGYQMTGTIDFQTHHLRPSRFLHTALPVPDSLQQPHEYLKLWRILVSLAFVSISPDLVNRKETLQTPVSVKMWKTSALQHSG